MLSPKIAVVGKKEACQTLWGSGDRPKWFQHSSSGHNGKYELGAVAGGRESQAQAQAGPARRSHLVQPLRVRDSETESQAGSHVPKLLNRGASGEEGLMSETLQESREGREALPPNHGWRKV